LLDSSSTRRLNSNHDNSRLMNRSGEVNKPDTAASSGTATVFIAVDLLLTALTARRANSASFWERRNGLSSASAFRVSLQAIL
jgi:hypothetical protein